MTSGTKDSLRQLIAKHIGGKIRKNPDPKMTPTPAELKAFIVDELKFEAEDDGHRHHTFSGYSSESAYTVLRKILAEDFPFKSGQRLPSAKKFEGRLLSYLQEQEAFSNVEIPSNIFRDSYREGQRLIFAADRYLRRDEDHAEYLCRRFIDKCANEPDENMGLRGSGNSGLVALIVLETFHANGIEHGKITFSDLFDDDLITIESIGVGHQQWPVKRVNPIGKPKLSHASIGGDVRERYSGSTSIKYEQTIQALQERVLRDFLHVSITELYLHIRVINGVLEQRFNSGSLVRTILDVEKGAIFVYQVDHGRFWVFGFCPIEGKVDQADDVLREKIIEHYENAIRE